SRVVWACALGGVPPLLLARVSLSDLAFFGGSPFFAVIGCAPQAQRKREALGEPYRAFADATPFLPFGSRGFARGLVELPAPIGIAVGIAIAFALRHWAHAWLAGSPVAGLH